MDFNGTPISPRDMVLRWNDYMALRHKRHRRTTMTRKEHQLLHTYEQLHGAGFFSDLFSYRKDFSKHDSKVFNRYKDYTIDKMVVVRTPLSTLSQLFADIASLGTFSKQAKKLGYDRVYHLYMLIYLHGVEHPFHYEKNETVILKEGAPATGKFTQSMPVALHSPITLGQFIHTAQKHMTPEEYWHYTFQKYNCQRFIKQNLEANGLLTLPLEQFIMQDAAELLAESPSVLKYLTQKASDGAALVRKITGTGNTI